MITLLVKGIDTNIKNKTRQTPENYIIKTGRYDSGVIFSQRKSLVGLHKKLDQFYDAVDSLSLETSRDNPSLLNAITSLQSAIQEAKQKKLLSIPNYINLCLKYLWNKATALCDKGVKDEVLAVVLSAAKKLFSDSSSPIDARYFIAMMHFSFQLQDFKLTQDYINIFIKLKFDRRVLYTPLDFSSISRMLISQIMLVFFDNLKVRISPEIASLLKLCWSQIYDNFTLTDIVLLQKPNIKPNIKILEAILKDLSKLKFSECIPKGSLGSEEQEFINATISFSRLFYSWFMAIEDKYFEESPRGIEELKAVKLSKENKLKFEEFEKFFQVKSSLTKLLMEVLQPLDNPAKVFDIPTPSTFYMNELVESNKFLSAITDKLWEPLEQEKASSLEKKKKKKKKPTLAEEPAVITVEEAKAPVPVLSIKASPPTIVQNRDKFAHLPDKIKEFIAKFPPRTVYLVGGAVRDILLGRKPNDYDFVIFLSIEELKQLFPGVQEQGKGKHQSMRLDLNGLTVDILPLNVKVDLNSSEEIINTLKQDSLRRDFTINALYWNPDLKLLDPTGKGKKHLFNEKLIEDVNPEVNTQIFRDDPIRILRAFYLILALNFSCSATVESQLNEKYLEEIMQKIYVSFISKFRKYFDKLNSDFDSLEVKKVFEGYSMMNFFNHLTRINGSKPPSPRLFDAVQEKPEIKDKQELATATFEQ